MATAQKESVWTAALERDLVRGAKANKGQARTEFYQEFAASLPSKPQWESVRAKYYAIMHAKGKPVGKPTGRKSTKVKPEAAAKKTRAAKPAAKRQTRVPSGLSGVKQQIARLEANVAATEQAHQQAVNELSDFRASLASLVG